MADAHSTGKSRTREQYRTDVRSCSKGNFTCINCGIASYRKLGGSTLKRGYENKFCSWNCRLEHSAIARAEKKSFEDFLRNEIKAIKRLGKATYKPKLKRCNCKTCGAEFIAKLGGGLHKQKCNACIDAVLNRSKRIHKAKRRAACKGVNAENVDPLSVFDRDKWRCKLCGRNAPRHKRGTCEDDAPELDHIIPLSKGGPHSYANTQCLCRKCNREKGGRPLGQLMLIG